ncbi:hypothetical protein [Psychrobacillus sp. L4]|uniref:hypothetical protein n=1 Tax=Psychrobacillus sp. L4 TaxID=3236892 RepID=UPI0036F3A0A1
MSLLQVFIAWIFVLFIEVYWLYIELRTSGSFTELIYVVMIISLVVGITGLNLYNKRTK